MLTGAGGFRMGPFALMDLIGHDVNEAVTRSVWAAFGHDPRFAPSLAQRALVEAGWLGRKSGRGATTTPTARPPVPAPAPPRPSPAFVTEPRRRRVRRSCSPGPAWPSKTATSASCRHGLVELPGGAAARPVRPGDRHRAGRRRRAAGHRRRPDARRRHRHRHRHRRQRGCPADALDRRSACCRRLGLTVFVIDDIPGLIVTRTVAMLANLAADALAGRVASEADIDTAMRLGVNYPHGPLAWARQWGLPIRPGHPRRARDWYRDGHYRPSPLLRRAALTNGALTNGAADMSSTIEVRNEGHVRWIGLNRPDKRNAIDQAMAEDFAAALEDARRQPCVLIVHSTTPGIFAAGADIAELRDRDADAALLAINAGCSSGSRPTAGRRSRWSTGPPSAAGASSRSPATSGWRPSGRSSDSPSSASASWPAWAATGGWRSWPAGTARRMLYTGARLDAGKRSGRASWTS